MLRHTLRLQDVRDGNAFMSTIIVSIIVILKNSVPTEVSSIYISLVFTNCRLHPVLLDFFCSFLQVPLFH